jgi:hypothetical protein
MKIIYDVTNTKFTMILFVLIYSMLYIFRKYKSAWKLSCLFLPAHYDWSK